MSLSAQEAAQQSTTSHDYKPAPYLFVGLQGGATRTFTNKALDRKWAPMSALSVGGYATPWLGARLQANGWQWDEDFINSSNTYSTKQYGGDLDLLLNFTGLLFPSRHNLINVVGVAGYGLHYAKFGSAVTSHPYPLSTRGNRWMRAGRLGGQIDLSVAKHFGIQLEGGYMKMHDHINDFKVEKWWPYLMAGINYKFAFKNVRRVAPTAIPMMNEISDDANASMGVAQPAVSEQKPQPAVQEPKPEPAPAPQPKKEEPKPVVKPAKVAENIFFDLAKSDVSDAQDAKIEAIVKFANENPDTKISLVGYADRGTGTAPINKRLSDQRVKAVKNLLVKKGVKASRISTDSKGDTVQPFANNDDNRVVIVVGE